MDNYSVATNSDWKIIAVLLALLACAVLSPFSNKESTHSEARCSLPENICESLLRTRETCHRANSLFDQSAGGTFRYPGQCSGMPLDCP